MKNFHTYNYLFKMDINVNVVSLCITFIKYNNISIYKKCLSNSNQHKKISKLENLNLNSFKIQKLRNQITQKVNKIIATIFPSRQEEYNAVTCDTKII